MRSPLPLFVLALAGCAAPGDFPSLRPRPFEAAGPPGLPVPPPPPAPPASAEITGRVAALVSRAQTGQAAFSRALVLARATAGRAGGRDSDSWIEAQSALSALDAARAPTLAAMAELDALNASGVDAAGLRFGDNDFAAIREASERVYALVQAQEAEIGRIAARIG